MLCCRCLFYFEFRVYEVSDFMQGFRESGVKFTNYVSRFRVLWLGSWEPYRVLLKGFYGMLYECHFGSARCFLGLAFGMQ